MKYFEFSENVIERIINELEKAEKFIRIAIFQLHNKNIFNVLNKKLKNGIHVEILTLPYDSINLDIQKEVVHFFKNLEKNGAVIYFCKWNIGDPERTTTAVGRWYSFHGKFIVTDRTAIALSANFTQQNELDALIIFENEPDKINEYVNKFDELLDLFINKQSGYNGNIRQKIINTNISNALSLFELPRIIETETHKNHWIKDYPASLCSDKIQIKDKLYICPFDIKGRNLLMELISESKEFVYISTESFTDIEASEFLVKSQLRGLDIRVLTGATSMDFSDRMQKMLRELLANSIKIHTTVENIHAKLIITDKRVVVSSINLNKMNLGFKRVSNLWRENTESISVCSDAKILSTAKAQYLNIFDNSIDISIILAEKIENQIGKMFISLFGLRSKKEVKTLFARLILYKEIQVKQFVLSIGKITAKLMQHFNKKMVDKNDFIMALILFYLSERKHYFDQLEEKINILNTNVNLINLLNVLQSNHFIEKEDDFYKINLESLF
jgi:hypothetical protein